MELGKKVIDGSGLGWSSGLGHRECEGFTSYLQNENQQELMKDWIQGKKREKQESRATQDSGLHTRIGGDAIYWPRALPDRCTLSQSVNHYQVNGYIDSSGGTSGKVQAISTRDTLFTHFFLIDPFALLHINLKFTAISFLLSWEATQDSSDSHRLDSGCTYSNSSFTAS